MKVLNQNVRINVRLQVSVQDIEIWMVLALILTVWSVQQKVLCFCH